MDGIEKFTSEQMRDIHSYVELSPDDYMRLGGVKVFEKLKGGEKKTYWLRCDYDTGKPVLLVRAGDKFDARCLAAIEPSLGESERERERGRETA